MSHTTDILNNAGVAEPQLEALEVLHYVLDTDELEVGAVSRTFFSQLCITFAFISDARLAEIAAACVVLVAKHSLVIVRLQSQTEPDGVYDTIKGLLLQRPDVAAELLEQSLKYANDRPYQSVQALMAVCECSAEETVSQEARRWLFNFEMVRNNPQMIRRIRELPTK